MSIEKIKDRIRMIEENNFEIDEIVGRNVFKPTDIQNIISASGDSSNNIFKSISKMDRNLKNVNATADKILGGSSTVIITDDTVVSLNQIHQKTVQDIYEILNNHGILTPEINPSTWEPMSSYNAKHINNILSLYTYKNGMVRLYFNDDNQTKLTFVRLLFPKGTDTKLINAAMHDMRNLNFINNAQVKTNQGLESIELTLK